ncbi:MAG: amino acid adenylation domain-containing protein, partial [bacterium]|nr:amino acid adenylation domain-containing protein [bacterium]
DLAASPLLRVGIAETTAQRYLLIEMHHIITDGTSLEILIKEFNRLNKDENLPPLKLRYRDYAEWQHLSIQKQLMKKQEKFWNKQFTGELPVLNLPTDYPRPLMQRFEGNNIAFTLEQAEAEALEETAKNNETTLYMIGLSIFTILLSKLGGGQDIITGTPVAGRRHAELENIIGMFVNTLAMRNFPAGEKPFKEYLREVKENTLAAFENQEYPFEDLVDRHSPKRDTGRNPIFDVMFSHQDIATGIDITGGRSKNNVRHTKEETETISKFDLTLDQTIAGEKIVFTIEYSVKLFKKETIQRITRYLKKTIAAIPAKPETRIMEIDIIPEEEKKRILIGFNDTAAEYPRAKTIHRLFEEQVRKTPDNIAAAGAGKMPGQLSTKTFMQLTYRELDERAGHQATRLQEKGFTPGAIAGLAVPPCVETVIAVLAVWKAGGAYLPIELSLPGERIKYMLADSNATMLLSGNLEPHDKEREGKLRDMRESIEIMEVENWRPCKRNERKNRAGKRISAECEGAPCEAPAPQNTAYVIYTSGTTGKPRGVMVPHSAFVNRLDWLRKRYGFTGGDVFIQKTPLTFDVSVCEMFRWITCGGRVIIMKPGGEKDPGEMLTTVAKQCATTIDFVPSMLKLFLEIIEGSGAINDVSTLKRVFVGVEPLRLELAKKFNRDIYTQNGTRLINAYGPTEATVDITAFDCSGVKDARQEEFESVPIGTPIQNTRVYILDKHGNIQPERVAGELCIAGQSLALGYLNNPELTVERFANYKEKTISDGTVTLNKRFAELFQQRPPGGPPEALFYRTGDLARWLPDGNIEFLGRIDHQVKVRGHRIELGEIENRLSMHPGVEDVVVLARREHGDGNYLCAYYVEGREKEQGGEFREYLSRYLPEYMIPAYYIKQEKIPVTANGKIDRKALERIKVPGKASREEYIAPRDEREEAMSRIWTEILGGREQVIGIDDNFFEIGGHSLKAMIMAARIHRELGVKLPLTEIFKKPSIRALGKLLKTNKQERYSAIKPVEKKEYYIQSPSQKRLYILQQMEMESTAYNMPVTLPLAAGTDIGRLEETIRALIRRHESLRTTFHMINETPVQEVHECIEFKIETYGPGQTFFRPFDLTQAPLIRVGISREQGETILLLDMHHIITDGVSQEILTEELTALYSGENLLPLTLQYKDYAEWQNSRKQKEKMKRQEEYWTGQYPGELPVLDLPTDYLRPKIQRFEGSNVFFEINEEQREHLKERAKKNGATLYMIILSSFSIMMSKLSGQEDIIIGTPTAGRRHAELEKIIGIFVNTLAMRNKPGGEKTIEEYLREVKKNTLQAFENQEYQFEDLVERLQVRRDTGRNPIFDVMFNLINQTESQAQNQSTLSTLSTLSIPSIPSIPSTSKFDLTLSVLETGDSLDIQVEYSTKLFKEGTINRFITYFKKILQTVHNTPHQKIKDIEIITEAEKSRILYKFNDTEADYPKDKTI